MNFQELPVSREAQYYLDTAFSRAKKRAGVLQPKGPKVERDKTLWLERMLVVKNTISKEVKRLVNGFPNFEGMSEFYEELTRVQLDVEKLRLSLGRIHGCGEKVKKLYTESTRKVKKAGSVEEVNKVGSAYYGRVSSLLGSVNGAFLFIEKSRKILVTFPTIKELFTVALAGFPNVGKSTLLSKITKAKPKIAGYAFTTKTLNIGYFKKGYEKIQVIDTPGTLARFEKMNAIEKQAHLCLKYVADIIVVVIDPTFPVDKQEKLLDQIKDLGKKTYLFLSKTDLIDKEELVGFKKRFKGIITDKDELKAICQEHI